MKTDKQKAQEILKKRELAAKHLKVRKDGKPIDPMEEVGTLDTDTDPNEPESTEDKEREIASAALPASLIKRR